MPDIINELLTNFFAGEFWKGLQDGYGVLLDGATDLQDVDMLTSLQENIYQFSSAKNYQQLKAISQALLDENGEVRNFSQFRTAAAEINNQFVNVWLQAEYRYAIAAGQMASRWKQIQADKEIFPLLQYDTVGDDRVRDEHREMDGIILPVDHPYWLEYFPPNGWGCRCDVRQLTTGKVKPEAEIYYPNNMPDIFKYNVGITGLAFPKNHPYYDGLPADIIAQANNLLLKSKLNKK